MPDKIRDLAAATSYEDVKLLVFDQVHQACRRWPGLNFADALSWAHEGFVQAFDTFNPKRSRFVTWVTLKVSHRLTDYVRWLTRQDKLALFAEDFDAPAAPSEAAFDLFDLMSGLGEDARYVVSLAAAPPPDVELTLKASGREYDPVKIRQGIKQFLAESGWDRARVKAAFQQIQEAL